MKSDTALEAVHVSLWATLLSVNFSTLSFRVFNPDQLLVFRDSKDGPELERLAEGLRRAQSRNKRCFFPLHCRRTPEHPDGHWTLLSVDSDGAFRYYGTMNEFSSECFELAETVLAALQLGQRVVRTNNFRQTGVDCTRWALHYLESEVRELNKEGWGACKPVSSLRKRRCEISRTVGQQRLNKLA